MVVISRNLLSPRARIRAQKPRGRNMQTARWSARETAREKYANRARIRARNRARGLEKKNKKNLTLKKIFFLNILLMGIYDISTKN